MNFYMLILKIFPLLNHGWLCIFNQQDETLLLPPGVSFYPAFSETSPEALVKLRTGAHIVLYQKKFTNS